MDKQETRKLLDKYLAGNCSAEEKAFIERFYMEELQKTELLESSADPRQTKEHMWKVISRQTALREERTSKSRRSVLIQLSAAAAILIIIGAAFFLLQDVQQKVVDTPLPKYANDIKPGENKAVLRLASGKNILLDAAKEGLLATESEVSIIKTKKGELRYEINSFSNSSNQIFYHTISTPKGGEYQVILADGTHIWINADSKMRFPAVIRGNTRNVELTGEAYFEVAKNKTMPFEVKAGHQLVQVLGTHFNVNAYADEKVHKTTLLEGSVRVSSGKEQHLIQPGEQARLSAGGQQGFKIEAVDVEEAIAWKNNKIMFSSRPLEEVMRQVSRWYNVEVVYKGNISKKVFTGSISRYENVSKVLEMLELTNLVHFKIEERRITVMP